MYVSHWALWVHINEILQYKVFFKTLPPWKLYFRVRAVFEIFGTKIDLKNNKPLFNKDAWVKAKNILK